jgi:hypothetical protein
MFEIQDAVLLESGKTKRDAARLVSGVEPIRHTDVVKYPPDDAFVVTAYLTDQLKPGETVWPEN